MERATTGVDIVFHVAAMAGIWGPWKTIMLPMCSVPRWLLPVAGKTGCRMLVYTSTPSVVFNREDIRGGDERLPYADQYLCHYAKSKVMAEKIVLDANSTTLATCATSAAPYLGTG